MDPLSHCTFTGSPRPRRPQISAQPTSRTRICQHHLSHPRPHPLEIGGVLWSDQVGHQHCADPVAPRAWAGFSMAWVGAVPRPSFYSRAPSGPRCCGLEQFYSHASSDRSDSLVISASLLSSHTMKRLRKSKK